RIIRGSDTIWHTITQQEPEIDENRARESIRRQSGAIDNRHLEVVATPGRVDVVMTPTLQDGLPQSYFGPAEEEAAKFAGLIPPWLAETARSEDVIRLAFGAIFILVVHDRDESYHHLSRFLHSVKVDPVNSREIMYRINRPKDYLDGLSLNRITTWN